MIPKLQLVSLLLDYIIGILDGSIQVYEWTQDYDGEFNMKYVKRGERGE